MIDWLTSDPIRAMMVATMSVIGGSMIPWQKLLQRSMPDSGSPLTPAQMTDSHVALAKLVDVIHVVRAHGDLPTAEALGALIPQVLPACCATHEHDVNS